MHRNKGKVDQPEFVTMGKMPKKTLEIYEKQ